MNDYTNGLLARIAVALEALAVSADVMKPADRIGDKAKRLALQAVAQAKTESVRDPVGCWAREDEIDFGMGGRVQVRVQVYFAGVR